jgi:hypothetical protein
MTVLRRIIQNRIYHGGNENVNNNNNNNNEGKVVLVLN